MQNKEPFIKVNDRNLVIDELNETDRNRRRGVFILFRFIFSFCSHGWSILDSNVIVDCSFYTKDETNQKENEQNREPKN